MTAATLDTAQAARRPVSRGARVVSATAIRTLAVLAVLLVWWWLSVTLSAGAVPSPAATLRRLGEIAGSDSFVPDIALTLGRVAAGMVLTVVVALGLGIAMGRSERVEHSLELLILVGRGIPGLVWALVSVMVVGLNNIAPVLAVLLTATPLVTLQIWEATKALGDDLFEMADTFRVGRSARLWHVLLPSLLPAVVAGTKLGLALAWQVVVLAELFGLNAGVGYEISQSFSNFDIAGVLAWTLAFSAIMAVIEYGVIGSLQRRLTRWRPASKAGRR